MWGERDISPFAAAMRYAEKALCLLLAAMLLLALPAGGEAAPAAAAAYGGEPVVRVGMYILTSVADSRWFSAKNTCESGFEVGYSDGTRFHKLFEIANKSIIILPQVNAGIDFDSECGYGSRGGRDYGAWSTAGGVYPSFAAASGAGDFAAVTPAGYEARSGMYFDPDSARAAGKAAAPAEGGIAVLDAETHRVIFTYEDASRPLALQGLGGAAVTLPMISFSGTHYCFEYPGFFEYTAAEDMLYMVNCLGLELYTKCVMANEIGGDFTKETRRAFSILARTFPLGKKHGRLGFDICSSPGCCQCYYGFFRMGEENNEIVESTSGTVCYYEGEPIAVLYHGANGGASCSSVAAWGGTEVPYLTSVFLENDEIEESARWERVFTKPEFYGYLTARAGFSSLADASISMQVLERDPYGSSYITTLSVSDGAGHVVELKNSETIRQALGFSSANFDLEYSAEMPVLTAEGTVETRRVAGVLTAEGYKPFEGFGDSYGDPARGDAVIAPDSVKISGVGSGHGVGFSATGSEKLSLEGFNYGYILRFFFKDTTLEKLY